ncbi:MAG: hypothetical protein KAS53_12185 [Candidatus Cloacimonetes bacterium]|nr:hypothetical protein [Candidatus Cloacimonadota bacterium]
MIGICRLCEKEKELKKSHLLPSFIFKWKKEQGTGFFRSSQNPNKRVQDGLKLYQLCADCEQRFGLWEKQFSEKLFKPFHDNSGTHVKYSEWLLKFTVSISWRNLIYHKLKNGLSILSETQRDLAEEALLKWKSFLMNQTKHIGTFEQHIFPVDIIKSYQGRGSLSPYLNRYFVGSVDFDLLRTKKTCFLYSKLNKLIVIGIIQQPSKDYLEGTLIEYPTGKFKPRPIGIPEQFFHYFNKRANQCAQHLSLLSDKQWEAISKSYEKDIDRLKNSDMFFATGVDVSISGQNAFHVLKSEKEKDKK